MALASCPARQGQQRSLRTMCQVLSWALARSGRGAELGVSPVGRLLRGGLVPPPVGSDHRLPGADISLVGEHDLPGRGQAAHNAPDPPGGQVMDGTGQRSGDPQDLPARVGDDLQVHPVLAVLAGVERPVGSHAVDGDERPVDLYECVPGAPGRRQRLLQFRRPGGQQGNGLLDIPPGSRGAYPEPGRQAGEGLAVAQVHQDQQCLVTRVQLAPARADRAAVAADHTSQVVQRRTRQRQKAAREKSIEAPRQTKGFGDRFIYQGLRYPRRRPAVWPGGMPGSPKIKLKKAHWLVARILGLGVIPGSPLVKAFAHRRDDIALESDGQSAGTLTYPERRDVGLAGRLRFRNGAMTSGLAVTLASFTYGLLFALYRSRVLAF
jgi:hypothetical protein